MTCKSDSAALRSDASLRLRPHALSARTADQSRLTLRREARAEARARLCLRNVHPSWEKAFSPFVPALDDSESLHADPSRTSLAIPDRLAGDQPDRSFHASRRALRALPTAARTTRRAARRHRWNMVGHRDRRLARRPRPRASAATEIRAAGRRADDSKARLPGDRSPQPRPDFQRSALAQPRSALSALPHNARRSRTSAPPVVERFSAARFGRPLHRALQLAVTVRCRKGVARPLGAGPRTWAGSALRVVHLKSGGRCWDGCRCFGAQHDRRLPDPRSNRVATLPRR